MYIQDIGKIEAEPNGADDTGPKDSVGLYSEFDSNKGWFGRNGARCFLLKIIYSEQIFFYEIIFFVTNEMVYHHYLDREVRSRSSSVSALL
jgi:hypothetical protein